MKKATIFLVGGGTGGHLLPVLAIATKLRAKISDLRLVLITQKSGKEQSIIEQYLKLHPKLDLIVEEIEAEKFYRYLDWHLLLLPWRFTLGIWQSWQLLNYYQPQVIFCKGGYLSLPVAIAGWCKRVAIVLHETDAVMGLANRLIKPLARRVAVSFPLAELKISNPKYIYTGNPLREEFETKHKVAITKEVKEIVIIGSSIGSRNLNRLIAPIIRELIKNYRLTHISGEKDYSWLRAITSNKFYRLYNFREDIAPILQKADLVISRAGGTIFELAALGRPTILIPLPWAASNHQLVNAEIFQKNKSAIVLEEKNLNSTKLLERIQTIAQDYELRQSLSKNIKKFANIEAANKVADLIINQIKT